MPTRLSSRERLLITIEGGQADRVPVVFFPGATIPPLEHCWHDRLERARYLLSLGLDEIFIFSSPWPFHPDVTTESWRREGDRYPVLYKRFNTPAGSLQTAAILTDDWQVAELPMYADQLWPRTVEPLVKTHADLEALDYLLYDPRRADLSAFFEQVTYWKRECRRLGVLFEAWMPPAPLHTMTFLGAKRMLYLVRDDPELVHETLRRVPARPGS